MKKEIEDYCNSCVSRLGVLVGEMREEGKAKGFSEEETKKVWLTIFSIFNEKAKKNEKDIFSKNLSTLIK